MLYLAYSACLLTTAVYAWCVATGISRQTSARVLATAIGLAILASYTVEQPYDALLVLSVSLAVIVTAGLMAKLYREI